VDFAESAEDAAFRHELRTWLDDRLPKFLTEWSDPDGEPAAPRGATGVMRSMERRRAWQRTLNEGRWAAINWPAEWGGRDATVTQNVIYSEEMARYRTPGIYNANGLWQIGPMIIRWGTEEQ
jgi:alkylation response protein AidB-like acyl-CoA dehydrogenase